MRLPSLTQIPPMPELPAGYTLRDYRDTDLNQLAEMLQLSFDDIEWNPELVRERLIDAADVKRTFSNRFWRRSEWQPLSMRELCRKSFRAPDTCTGLLFILTIEANS